MKKGFLLIEVIVSISLIAIVMSLVISLLIISTQTSKKEEDTKNAWRIIHNMHQRYLSNSLNLTDDLIYFDENLVITDEENAKYIVFITIEENQVYKQLIVNKVLNKNDKEIISQVDLGKVLL